MSTFDREYGVWKERRVCVCVWFKQSTDVSQIIRTCVRRMHVAQPNFCTWDERNS